MIEVLCAKELGDAAKKRISEIFVDAFGHHLSFFSKDKNKLAEALEHMFVLDVFPCRPDRRQYRGNGRLHQPATFTR